MALEVLVVDDEADIRELVSGVLEDGGYAVRTAANSEQTLTVAGEEQHSVKLELAVELASPAPVAPRGWLQVVCAKNGVAVSVDGSVIGAIGRGLLILLGVGQGDSEEDIALVAEKLVYLRIFADQEGRSNLSLLDVGGAALVVSQFTLYADTRKGRRPSWSAAAPGPVAEPMIARLVEALRARGVEVAEGRFGAMMEVSLVNDGPFTLVVDA